MSHTTSLPNIAKAFDRDTASVAMQNVSPIMHTAPIGSGLTMMPMMVPTKMASNFHACRSDRESCIESVESFDRDRDHAVSMDHRLIDH